MDQWIEETDRIELNQNLFQEVIGDNQKEAHFGFSKKSHLKNCIQGYTNVGLNRKVNQDAIGVTHFEEQEEKHFCLGVADGLGCYRLSQKAAKEALYHVPRLLDRGCSLEEAFLTFHQNLLEGYPYIMKQHRAKSTISNPSPKDRGATTLVLAEILENQLKIANVGDSRAFLIRDGKIIYQSLDQSLVELMAAKKEIPDTEKMKRRHPLRHILLNALGSPEDNFEQFLDEELIKKPTGTPVIDELELQKGDHLILATDGVFPNLSNEEIVEYFSSDDWESISEKVKNRLFEIFEKNRTIFDEKAALDNFSFLVYRHF